MTMVEIKQELRRRKLKTAGLKNELILRLLPFLQLEREHGETGRGDDAQNKDDEDARRNRETTARAIARTTKTNLLLK